MSDMAREAIKSVSQFNSELNKARKEERRFSFDLQTLTVHHPVGLGSANSMLQKNIATGRCLKVGRYPVATIHGQYQDWYIRYSPQELNYFPINTVMYGPIFSDEQVADTYSSASDSASDSDSSSSRDSGSSSAEDNGDS